VQLELGSASLFAKKKGTSGFFQSQLDTSERMDTIGGHEVVTEEDIPRPRHPARGLAQARRNGQLSGRWTARLLAAVADLNRRMGGFVDYGGCEPVPTLSLPMQAACGPVASVQFKGSSNHGAAVDGD
jgi:hypothetical protein